LGLIFLVLSCTAGLTRSEVLWPDVGTSASVPTRRNDVV
jgi:hypothetical protein